jgi:hypothetical protein
LCVFSVVTAMSLDVLQAAVPDTATHLAALKCLIQFCGELFTWSAAGDGCLAVCLSV